MGILYQYIFLSPYILTSSLQLKTLKLHFYMCSTYSYQIILANFCSCFGM